MFEQILELIENKSYVKAKEELVNLNVVDIAAVLEEISGEDLVKMFRLMPKDIASDIFSYIPIETGRSLITSLTESEATAIIEDLYADDAADVLEEMPAAMVARLLSGASDETRKNINHLLQYPESSAGSIMTVEYVDIKKSLTVAEAIEKVRAEGVDKETINFCYVTDYDRRLLGIVSLRRLLLSRADEKIESIMTTELQVIKTLMDQEEVATMFQRYDLTAMPVVDSEGRLVGIITVDDVVDIIQHEASEDMAIMAAVTPSDKPYLKTSLWRVFFDRVPWLLLLLVSATFTGMIITANEEILAQTAFGIILMASIPMLMDSGGNAGSQANVTVIRGLSLQEITMKDIPRVLWKEVRLSLMLGAALGFTCYIKLMLIDRLYEATDGFMIAFVISLSLFITIFIAKTVGCIMPFIAKRLKLDPAVVASPFITTIVDAVALIVYCNIAITILS